MLSSFCNRYFVINFDLIENGVLAMLIFSNIFKSLSKFSKNKIISLIFFSATNQNSIFANCENDISFKKCYFIILVCEMLLYIYANLNMKYYENNANFYKWGKLIEITCIFLILHELHPMEKYQ